MMLAKMIGPQPLNYDNFLEVASYCQAINLCNLSTKDWIFLVRTEFSDVQLITFGNYFYLFLGVRDGSV
jgi:hypothetical protein